MQHKYPILKEDERPSSNCPVCNPPRVPSCASPRHSEDCHYHPQNRVPAPQPATADPSSSELLLVSSTTTSEQQNEGLSALIILFDLPKQSPVNTREGDVIGREKIPLLVHALISEVRTNDHVTSISGILLLTKEELTKEHVAELRNQNIVVRQHPTHKPFPSLLDVVNSQHLEGNKTLFLVSVLGDVVTKSLCTVSEEHKQELSPKGIITLTDAFYGEKRNKLGAYINSKLLAGSGLQPKMMDMDAFEDWYANFCVACFKGQISLPVLAEVKAGIARYGISPVDYAIRGGNEDFARQLAGELGLSLTPYQACLLTEPAAAKTMILLDWQNIHVARKDTCLFLQAIKQFATANGRAEDQCQITVFIDRTRLADVATTLAQEGGARLAIVHIDGGKSGAADAQLIDCLRDGVVAYQSILLVSGDRDFSPYLSYYSQKQGCPIYLISNEQAWFSFKTNPQWTASIDYFDLPKLEPLKAERLAKKEAMRNSPLPRIGQQKTTRRRGTKPCDFYQKASCKNQDNPAACTHLHVCKRCHGAGAATEEHPEKKCYRPEFSGFVLAHPYINFKQPGWQTLNEILSPAASPQESATLSSLQRVMELFYVFRPGLGLYNVPSLKEASEQMAAFAEVQDLIQALYGASFSEELLGVSGASSAHRSSMIHQLMNSSADATYQAQILAIQKSSLPPLALLILGVLYNQYAYLCHTMGEKLRAIYAINMASICLEPSILGAQCHPEQIDVLFESLEMNVLKAQIRYNQLLICTHDFSTLHSSNMRSHLAEHMELHQFIEKFLAEQKRMTDRFVREVNGARQTGGDSAQLTLERLSLIASMRGPMMIAEALPRLELNVRRALNRLIQTSSTKPSPEPVLQSLAQDPFFASSSAIPQPAPQVQASSANHPPFALPKPVPSASSSTLFASSPPIQTPSIASPGAAERRLQTELQMMTEAPLSLHFHEMTPKQVSAWASGKGDLVKKSAPLFENSHISGAIFLDMPDSELQDLGIASALARKLILKARQVDLDKEAGCIAPDTEDDRLSFKL